MANKSKVYLNMTNYSEDDNNANCTDLKMTISNLLYMCKYSKYLCQLL